MTSPFFTGLQGAASTRRGRRPLVASSPSTRFCCAVAAGAFVAACWPGGALIVLATFVLLFLVSAAAGTLLGLRHVFRLVLAATILGATLGGAGQLAVTHAPSLGVGIRAPLPPGQMNGGRLMSPSARAIAQHAAHSQIRNTRAAIDFGATA